MNRKIWKALGIAVCMLALAAPRAMAETKVHMVTAQTNLVTLFEEINKPGDDENVIELCENITLTDNYTLTNDKATTIKTTTIKGEGHTIFVKPNAGITVTGKGNVLNLGAEGYKGTLTIDRDPRDVSVPEDIRGAFITVSGGATANMYGNVTLQNWQFAGNACVVIMGPKLATGSNSVFNMCGGVIENCSRAVTAGSRTTFNMSGGKIRNREGIRGSGNGGGVRVYEATFVMSGGTISGCTADTGGGLYADHSTITINNGTISGCKTLAYKDGGGLYADNSAININKGTISGCDGRWGGGLYAENSSTITITDSTISGCKAGAGGGLFVVGSTLNIKDDIISECTASDTGNGGGLYAKDSTIKITGGRIENNKAAHGGGVALIGKTTFEKPITNWTVIGNEAYATGGVGGGIKLENGSMDVSDGFNRIYNNTAGGQGADIFLLDGNASIKLPIAANMYHDSSINIDGWYKDDNPRYMPSEDGKPVENLQQSGPLSLVASYTVIPMRTVTIDANGGVGGSGSQTVQKGTNVTLEAPTKEGHLFKGWKDEKGNSYPAGEDGKVNITVNENMKLTAVWKARTFTVTYVLLNGETRTETAAYGQKVTLGEEPRTGYTFVGWKDGEKMYHAGETITVTGDMTLTAEWKKLPSAENLPKTGDESPVLLWGAALAVSAAACFMLRRKK